MAFLSNTLLTQFAKENALQIDYEPKTAFARQLKQLEVGDLDLLVGVYPIVERLEKYIFSSVYFYDDLYVYAYPQRLKNIKTIDDLKKYVGVVVRGASYGKALDQFYQLHPEQMYLVKHESQGVDMAEVARVDYIILRQHAEALKHARLIKQSSQPISHIGGAFAMSNKSACLGWLPHLNQLIEKTISSSNSNSSNE
jgi:hypothetical protein